MDELGFNKIAGAILATALGFMLLKEVSHSIVHSEAPDVPAYALELPTEGPVVEEVKAPFPQAEWVAAMDADRGARVFKKCVSCHNNEAGGANGTGPNLYGVVGAPAAVHDGFAYSNALKTSGKTWTYASLDGFLERPGRYISGTNMNFIGLKKPEDRAAVIEYLRTGAANPIPRPEVAAFDPAPTEEVVVEADPGAVIEEMTAQDAPIETPEMVEQ
ncbi:cytochrome c family protein [Fretibacter rubidus]|uniref:c-type cytochrome n=1 Tax=Fretibacter rubidus TaxID=570162 RepID=UPI00352B906A